MKTRLEDNRLIIRDQPFGFWLFYSFFVAGGSIALILSLTAAPNATTSLIGSIIGFGNIAGGLYMIKREPASIVEIDKASGEIRVCRWYPVGKRRKAYPLSSLSAVEVEITEHSEGGSVYPEDPYTACGGPEMRRAFKIASLIGINAPNIRKAYRAIRAKFEEENIPLPMVKRPLKYLIETFKAKHQPIANSICSDAGIELQNIDSHIMNSILMRLMDMGILGLSVYDSVIVAEEFAEIARVVMIEEYQNVFGFKPRV